MGKILLRENMDSISQLWTPDRDLCEQAEAYRQENEWLRKKNGAHGIMKPTELGIHSYIYGKELHPRFYEGRFPPPVPLDSLENLEWYEEQLTRCVYGYEYKGQRVTGDMYWFLNFTPFMVNIKDKYGNPTKEFRIDFPYYSVQHDYMFKTMEEAHFEGKGFMWMSGRGCGKTYSMLSVVAKIYHLKPGSHGIISASNSGHADEAFRKFKSMLRAVAEVHPTMQLARLTDTKHEVMAGYEITKDGIKMEAGPLSHVNKVIYGDNPGVTRGGRPDVQLIEEVGDFPGGKGSLKKCIGSTVGSWKVGNIYKCRVLMIGTGGSVTSDHAKDVFMKPDAFNMLEHRDFGDKATCCFTPSHYLYGGMGWERTGVNNNEEAKQVLDSDRERTKADMTIHQTLIQEFPYTPEECFRKSGTNNFNQMKIASQYTSLHNELSDKEPERGFLEWVKTTNGKIVSVKWNKNPEGNIEIVEHPYRGEEGESIYPNLYVMGVDGIDQGKLDSTSDKNRSSMAGLVKKRIVDGQFFKQTNNIYVAKYLGRSDDVRDDFEQILMLSMYYDAKVNLEYTKIGLASYFRECKQYHRLMARPLVAMPSGGDGINIEFGIRKNTNLIGTPATTAVIDHQDGKVKEYIDDYYQHIFFKDMLEQLRDYQREDRTDYDMVIAMGLCELADEDLLGIVARPELRETVNFTPWGYYKDAKGYRRYGPLPTSNNKEQNMLSKKANDTSVRWVDMTGKPRFDSNFNALLGDDGLVI